MTMRPRSSLLMLSLVLFSLLGGCVTVPTGTDSKADGSREASAPQHRRGTERPVRESENERYNERIAQVSKDIRAICTSPANRLYYAKTPCLPSGMTEAHLKDGSRITPQARRVAQQVFENLHKLNEDTRDLMTSLGDARLIRLARHSREVVDPKIEAMQAALLTGAMTWGQYNRARLEVFESSKAGAPAE